LQLVPNPAKSSTSARYQLNEASISQQGNTLEVYDINGKRLLITHLNNKAGSSIINTSSWSNGVYVVQLRQNGKTIKTQKLVVAK